MKKLLLAACLCAAGSSGSAFAAEGFVRGEFGNSSVDIDVSGVGSASDDDQVFLFGGGAYFTPNFGAEAFYANLFDVSEDGASAELQGFGLGVVAKKNFGADQKGFYIAGRAGVLVANGEVSDGVDTLSDNSARPYFGVGAGYDVNENFGLGVNYTRYSADFEDISADVDTVTASLEFRF
jgi:hypothetical protein